MKAGCGPGAGRVRAGREARWPCARTPALACRVTQAAHVQPAFGFRVVICTGQDTDCGSYCGTDHIAVRIADHIAVQIIFRSRLRIILRYRSYCGTDCGTDCGSRLRSGRGPRACTPRQSFPGPARSSLLPGPAPPAGARCVPRRGGDYAAAMARMRRQASSACGEEGVTCRVLPLPNAPSRHALSSRTLVTCSRHVLSSRALAAEAASACRVAPALRTMRWTGATLRTQLARRIACVRRGAALVDSRARRTPPAPPGGGAGRPGWGWRP